MASAVAITTIGIHTGARAFTVRGLLSDITARLRPLSAPAIRHASAQQPATKQRLAVIAYKAEDFRMGAHPLVTAFLEELQRLGYVEGANLIIDRVQYQSGRLEEIAREVVATNPDVIVSPGTPMTLRLKAATTTIPIVAMTGDPLRFRLITKLARPGGKLTGVSVS